MKYEKSCGAIIFTNIDGKIKYVIEQQIEGFHGFPKGHVEGNETEKETALREVFEEVGLKPTIVEGFRTTDEHLMPKKPGVLKQVVYFLAEYENQEIKIQEAELKEAKLMTYEEAMEVFEYESSKRMLTEANQFLKERVKK